MRRALALVPISIAVWLQIPRPPATHGEVLADRGAATRRGLEFIYRTALEPGNFRGVWTRLLVVLVRDRPRRQPTPELKSRALGMGRCGGEPETSKWVRRPDRTPCIDRCRGAWRPTASVFTTNG
jgi:hypothetical protein